MVGPGRLAITEQQHRLNNIDEKGKDVMRVVVNMMQCESNALCVGFAPEVFEMNDDDELVVLDETPDEALRERLEQAVRACPKQAIRLEV